MYIGFMSVPGNKLKTPSGEVDDLLNPVNPNPCHSSDAADSSGQPVLGGPHHNSCLCDDQERLEELYSMVEEGVEVSSEPKGRPIFMFFPVKILYQFKDLSGLKINLSKCKAVK